MVGDLIRIYKKYFKRSPYGWKGDFKSWQQASSHTKGYDSQNIIQKVTEAVLKVKNEEAIYERDSVLFDKIEYSWPLLAALLWISLKKNGELAVVDFGGSLGSSYFQNRNYLATLKQLKWHVVEQPSFVKIGKEKMQTDILEFHHSIEEVIGMNKPDILLISCTLPYIEKPYELIDALIQLNIPYVLVDNTPFNFERRDRITIQKVPPQIYEASYPCWFLDYERVKLSFLKKYILVSEHINETSIELDGHSIPYKGFLLELKPFT